MIGVSEENASACDAAAGELAGLHRLIGEARASLAELQREVSAAERHLDGDQAAQLVEANAQLLVSALRAQADAETAERETEEVTRSAERDGLTHLPNRLLLLDRLTHAIAAARRHGHRLALLFVDLDNFKPINDTLGHAVGDEVLKRAAQCLATAVREADTVSRHGGDEFLILLDEVTEACDAAEVADKVIAALAGPHHVGDQVLSLGASIGISLYPDHGQDADILVERADAAMYHAKRHGHGCFAFHGEQPTGERAPLLPIVQSTRQLLDGHERALAAHELQHTQQQEANTQLLLAALSAQDLQGVAEQAQLQQTHFLAVLAHELRSPLAPISNAAALLGRLPADELLPRLQAVIERQVAHMSRLVGDLLDVSRASTGKLRLERRPLDLAALISEVADAGRPPMAARRQRLDVRLPSRALEVHGDPVRLSQVFSNLLDNASKYTPVGGAVGLLVEVASDSIVITVSDSGIGITEEALPHVFDPFVQDTHAIGFNGAGLGIGLTVVRELVEAHGGTVVAASAGPGLGSQFVITLPRIEADPAH